MRSTIATAVLVHLASGVGNIVLATPLLQVLDRHGHRVDVLIDGDYAETADLLLHWSVVRAVHRVMPALAYDRLLAAIPPFYWQRYRARYRADVRCVPRPSDSLFYADEQRYYLSFAQALNCAV